MLLIINWLLLWLSPYCQLTWHVCICTPLQISTLIATCSCLVTFNKIDSSAICALLATVMYTYMPGM